MFQNQTFISLLLLILLFNFIFFKLLVYGFIYLLIY